MKKKELMEALQGLVSRLSALTRALDVLDGCGFDRMDVVTTSFVLDGVCVTLSGKSGGYMLVVCAPGFTETMSDVSVPYMINVMRKRVDVWYKGEYDALAGKARAEGIEDDVGEAVS